jgi:hypothetical protein
MQIKKFRLQSPDEDASGTDVQELEPDDTGEDEQLDEEPVGTGEDQAEDAQDEAPEELVVTLGEEQAEEEEPAKPWVNDLRKRYREEQKRSRQLEEQLQALQGAKQSAPEKEPELEDFDYDADKFKAAYREWTGKKAEADRQAEAQRAANEETAKEFQKRQEEYVKGKARFQKEKIQEAEEEVVSRLPASRQSMLLDIADDPAALVAALGSSPDTLSKLAAIKSDGKFIKELVKIEMNVKVKPRTTPPPPERTISGSGKTPGASSSNLDRLHKEAQESGNYDKYYAEMRRRGK